MRTLMLFCSLCLALGMAANGQTTIDKIGNGLYEADKAKGTLDKLKGWLPKKKSKIKEKSETSSGTNEADGVVPTGSKISVITITGIEFAKLKAFKENIEACQGVQSANYKFGSPVSTITVTHTGTTEVLLGLIEQTSKDIFTDKNIQSFEEGTIVLKL